MIEVKINGKTLSFESGVTVSDVLEAFDDKSVEYVFAVKIDGEVFDLDDTITHDCEIEPISFRDIRGRQQFSREQAYEETDHENLEEQENSRVGAAVGNAVSQDGYSEIENEIKNILGGLTDEDDDPYLNSDEALMMLQSVAKEVMNDSYAMLSEEIEETASEEDQEEETAFEEDEAEETAFEEDEAEETVFEEDEAEETVFEEDEAEETASEKDDFDMSVFDMIVPRSDLRVNHIAEAAAEEPELIDESGDYLEEADDAEEYGTFGSFGEFGGFAEDVESDQAVQEPDYSVQDSDFEEFLIRSKKSDDEVDDVDDVDDVEESESERERKKRQMAVLTNTFYNDYFDDKSDDETDHSDDTEKQRRDYAHSRRQKRRAKRAIQVAALLIALAGLGWIVGKAALKAVGSSDHTVSGTGMVSDSEAVSATDISESDFMVDGKPQYRAKLLTLGSANELVGMVQIRLSELNYLGEKDVNKIYGTKMSKAIEQFRAVNKIKSEGDIDQETFNALFSDKAMAAPVSASDAGTTTVTKSTSVTSATTTEATTQSTTKETTKKTTTTTRRRTTTTTTTTRRRTTTTTTTRRRRTTTTTQSTTIEEPTQTTTAEEPTSSTTVETSSTTKKTTTKKTTTKKTTTKTTTEPTQAPTSEPTSAPTQSPSSKEENTGSTTDGE